MLTFALLFPLNHIDSVVEDLKHSSLRGFSTVGYGCSPVPYSLVNFNFLRQYAKGYVLVCIFRQRLHILNEPARCHISAVCTASSNPFPPRCAQLDSVSSFRYNQPLSTPNPECRSCRQLN